MHLKTLIFSLAFINFVDCNTEKIFVHWNSDSNIPSVRDEIAAASLFSIQAVYTTNASGWNDTIFVSSKLNQSTAVWTWQPI